MATTENVATHQRWPFIPNNRVSISQLCYNRAQFNRAIARESQVTEASLYHAISRRSRATFASGKKSKKLGYQVSMLHTIKVCTIDITVELSSSPDLSSSA